MVRHREDLAWACVFSRVNVPSLPSLEAHESALFVGQ